MDGDSSRRNNRTDSIVERGDRLVTIKLLRRIVLLFLLLSVPPAFAQSDGTSKPAASSTPAPPTPAGPGEPFGDVVPQTSTFDCKTAVIKKDYLTRGSNRAFKLASSFDWSSFWLSGALPTLDTNASYVVNLTEWQAKESKYTLVSSGWYVYKNDGNTLTQANETNSAGKPLLPYGSKQVVVLSIQTINADELTSRLELDQFIAKNPLSLTFGISLSKVDAENWSNLGVVLGAIFSLKGVKIAASTGIPVCVETASVAIEKLPSDLNVTVTLTPGKTPGPPGNPGKGTDPVVCFQSDKGCTLAHTFNAAGKERWDINLGVTLPGVRESTFSLDNKTNLVTKSVTRHTDVYGFVSFYPAYCIARKNSFWPHVELGIPFTGQPLHRPFGGAAEKIPWSEKIFKVPAFFYGGVVRLIEETTPLAVGSKPDATTFTAVLDKKHVVWKGMYGIEFPVGSLLSKIGSKK